MTALMVKMLKIKPSYVFIAPNRQVCSTLRWFLNRNHSVMVIKKMAIFIKTVQHATLHATYRNLPQIFFSLFLTSAVIPVKLPPTQKHFQKIKLDCWCAVCRAFTCLTDTRGRGRRKGRGDRKKESTGER